MCFGYPKTPSPYPCTSKMTLIFFKAKDLKEVQEEKGRKRYNGKEEKGIMGRKGGKKEKHPRRRAEAIRNAC